jgi:hypothetical protein
MFFILSSFYGFTFSFYETSRWFNLFRAINETFWTTSFFGTQTRLTAKQVTRIRQTHTDLFLIRVNLYDQCRLCPKSFLSFFCRNTGPPIGEAGATDRTGAHGFFSYLPVVHFFFPYTTFPTSSTCFFSS